MQQIHYDAIDKLFYTQDKYTDEYRKKHLLKFDNQDNAQDFSLALAAYLEAKIKLKTGKIALGLSTQANPNVLALEMNIKNNDRMAVSISEVGAIYGLWFKRDNIFVNSSISVGASFRESMVLVGLILQASLIFSNNKEEIKAQYDKVVQAINNDQDVTEKLKTLNKLIREFAADFVWLNNIGEISYRELYISALPYKSAIDKVLEDLDNFILYPRF